jgi:quercetin dioxygenase-like cupin family protein
MTQEIRAEIRLPTQELRDDLPFYTKTLGFRLDMIFPADNPSVAVLSGHGVRLRIEKGASEAPGTLRILTDDPGFAGGAKSLVAPNGTRVEVDELNPPVITPATEHAFVVRRLADQAPWVIGRAGMEYRDLVPTRLGGAMIASHIRVPDGPVPDMVHYHKVGFQLIFCVAGWVDVLYEDQGGIRRIHAGDCFIQPPGIRHKVLHSEGVQVVEIGVPAEHVTEIDHEMVLPTPHYRPEREWDGQRFVHDIGKDGVFKPFRIPGFEARDTGIMAATKGVASVMVARPVGEAPWTVHDGDILFTFVMQGAMTLEGEGKDPFRLSPGDAFVIPPGMATRYSEATGPGAAGSDAAGQSRDQGGFPRCASLLVGRSARRSRRRTTSNACGNLRAASHSDQMVKQGVAMTLLEAATAVRERAYAPYSRFKVGAALRSTSGAVHVGCNVENVAYPRAPAPRPGPSRR